MIELSIRFTTTDENDENGPIKVAFFRPDTGVSTAPQEFEPPLDDKILGDIHWYLETFSTWPTGPDYVRAGEIESQLEEWGRALRDSILTDTEAARLWQQFVDARGDDRLLTLDATDPRVLRLPWELLADDGGHLFSQEIGIRRRLQQPTTPAKQAALPLPVRILVVVARPDDAGFIDGRAITRPLLDAVDGLGEQVVVEFLPRPTLKTLSQRLRDRNAPPVHVVHFDGHGVYDRSLGLGFLLFENDKHESDPVDANRLGTLLNQSGVPLIVLNACQSAMQKEGNPYASVASRLIRAGVGSVLAMNYSVLVVAAHKFVAAFYAALAAGRTVGQAVDAGRFALLEDVERHTLVRPDSSGELAEETIRLYDWFLPALYQQNSDPVIFAAPAAPLPGNSELPASAAPIIPVRQTYPALVRLVQEKFNEGELRQLCHNLGVQYDDLPGAGNAAKALALVELAERQDAVAALVSVARQTRPLANWDAALTPSAAAAALHPAMSSSHTPSPVHPLTPSRPPAALPAPPRHGFHGRSREMLLLDRAFLDSAIVVLHGFGGLGKTTLAAEAGRWFSRTGRFPGGAAFVSFEQGGSLEQLCSWVGQTVSGDPDWVIHGEGPLVDRVGQLLAERPALLILDNFESVLGRSPLMPPEEVAQVLDAVWQWSVIGNRLSVNGNPITDNGLPITSTRVLITTRDTTFNDARFAPSKECRHVALQGLAETDALALAAAVLDHHAIDRAAVPRADLVALMRHLGGHPLSLNLVLPQLHHYTAQQLIERFEELLPGFVQGKAEERNESLAVSLDFSLRRLGEETRAALPALAVFQGGCMELELLAIVEIDEEQWRVARSELEQAALVRLESLPGIGPPFLHFHPTLLPYLATQLDATRRAELETKYWQRYYALASYLYQTDTQNPHQARAIAVRELPNLRRALDLALAAAQADPAADPALQEKVVWFSTYIASFLTDFGRWRERDAMMAEVGNQFSVIGNRSGRGEAGGAQPDGNETGDAPPASPKLTKGEYLLYSRQGETLLQQGRAAQAETLFRQLLARLQTGADYDDQAELEYDIAMTQARLGRCLAAQGRPSQAIPFHQQAIKGFSALSENNKSAKDMLGKVYNDLADNFTSVGQFDEAQANYETALKVKREVDDQRAVGVTLGQLGTLALWRGDRAAARQRYTEALTTFQRLGEPREEAHNLNRIGTTYLEEGMLDSAEKYYRQALQLYESIRDFQWVAGTCNQLALVAEGDGRFADAERWYLRAQEIKDQVAPQDFSTLGNLASLCLEQNRLDEAAQYARRALSIQETLDLSAQPWKTYHILAQIAAAQGDTAAARDWRRKEQASYAAYAGSSHEMQQYQPLIRAVVAAAQGNEQAQQQIEPALQNMANGDEVNRSFAKAARQILAGERDSETLTDELSHTPALMVLTILQQLSGGEGGTQPDPLAQLREVWGPVVAAAIAAAQGNTAAAAQLEPVLQELAGRSDWSALVGVLRQILSGARDAALLQGLDQTDTIIAGNILRGLGVDHPALANLPSLAVAEPPAGSLPDATPPTEPAGGSAEQSANDFFNSLLNGVVAVARGEGPTELGVQLHDFTRGLATDPNAPPELQGLGRVLNAILSGERQPDLSGLPPNLAAAVRQVLGEI
ncbi:MAG: tetratricopeptide repeat protein [Anaerolineaceae bacterium]|nr:tetratricopeptide repeat protein [Anaerolineaceae bacterium]